jgi:hypothetical protein
MPIVIILLCILIWSSPKTAALLLACCTVLAVLYYAAPKVTAIVPGEYLAIGAVAFILGAGVTLVLSKL